MGAWAYIHISTSLFSSSSILGSFSALALGAVLLAVKTYPKTTRRPVPWYDWLLAFGGMAIGLYVTDPDIRRIAYRLGVLSPERWILGGLAVLLLLEATRRVAGCTLAWIALALHSLRQVRRLFSRPFCTAKARRGRGSPPYLYLDSDAILGCRSTSPPASSSPSYFFGQALYAVGGDKFLTDLALIAMGRYRGGPAKVSVVSSALFGTVSGSAVANVAVNGAITIPTDEAHRLSGAHGRGHRSGGVERRTDHAAGHGRGGVLNGRVSQYPLRSNRAGGGDPRRALLSRAIHPG